MEMEIYFGDPLPGVLDYKRFYTLLARSQIHIYGCGRRA